MNLAARDLHLTFNDTTNRLTVWNAWHQPIFVCEARNSTVNDGTFGHFGNCPRGEFLLAVPVRKDEVPFGAWFIPILDYGDHHAMRDWGRAGIGIHGGGSGLAHPFAPEQGWCETHGCLRTQNRDLGALIRQIIPAQTAGGRCYLTVAGEAG